MSRNITSFFSEVAPTLDIGRSKFEMVQDIKTSFDCGSVVPFYWTSVLPGDSHSIDTSKVIRMSTLVAPIMDNIYVDTYYFFVPYRLVWEHWKQFMGENTESAWIPEVTYSIPQITSPEDGWNVGTIADYLGLPTGVGNLSVSALPFRAYALVCNEWFRDENLTDPIYVPVDDSTQSGSNGSEYVNDVANGGMPFIASKYMDMFTGALPAPQAGPDVPLPLGSDAPVFASSSTYPMYEQYPISFINGSGDAPSGNVALNNGLLYYDSSSPSGLIGGLIPNNLYADLSLATGTSINQLRQAFQVQKFYEKLSIGGRRYGEIVRSMFGVTNPDARIQRPEYLGGTRQPINVTQVVQNSETSDISPQGHVTAYSLTIDSHSDFTKSFTEHGIILGLAVVRYNHTYQQGIEREWSRTLREDFYFPVFAHLGEQEVLNKEIYATGTDTDNEVFGYQERFIEYRTKPNKVTGMMRSNYEGGSLDLWHLADDYNALPSLSDSWIREDKTNLDRCLAVTSDVAHQFIANFYVKDNCVRVMPLYGTPGLIDHH